MEKEIILKELDILAQVIMKHEEIRIKIKGWVIAIFIALTTAYLSKGLGLLKGNYLLISGLIILLFLWIEVVYSVAQFRAVERGLIVESTLRNEIEYDGPKLGVSISRNNNLKAQLKVLNNIRIYGIYLALIVITLLIYFFN